MAKESRWKHPRAPAVRKQRKEEATEAVSEFFGEARAGYLQAARVRAPAEAEGEGAG